MGEQGEYLKPNALNLIDLPDRYRRTIRPGDSVRIIDGAHPHYGRAGVYRGVNVLAGGLTGVKIDFDDGGGCYIFKAHQWEQLS